MTAPLPPLAAVGRVAARGLRLARKPREIIHSGRRARSTPAAFASTSTATTDPLRLAYSRVIVMRVTPLNTPEADRGRV
jgi:hypothetical protein